MEHKISLQRAQEILLPYCSTRGTEFLPIEDACGRISAAALTAREDFPLYARSPFDGYAFRSEDVPGTLRVVELIPAGSVPKVTITAGTAARIMTGAPVPPGANAITKFEETEYTEESVYVPVSFKTGQNVIPAGEDMKRGTVLVRGGERLTPSIIGTLAVQGIAEVEVYLKPRIGIISTGSEVNPINAPAAVGKLRDSNSYTLTTTLRSWGCDTVLFGIVSDETGDIAAMLQKAAKEGLDAVISTGGASVGDFDLITDAFDAAGAETLAWSGNFRPGGAFAVGTLGKMALFGLSGNPASALTTLNAAFTPAIKKLCGLSDYKMKTITVQLTERFNKPLAMQRLIRGTLVIENAASKIIFGAQGNGMLTSWTGRDIIAVIPAITEPLEPGSIVEAYVLGAD